MRKFITCCTLIITLAACVRAGDYDLLPFRKSIVNAVRGYSIHDFNSEVYVGTADIRENETVMNKAITVKKGEDVLSDKLYDKSTYQKTVFVPNRKGSLNSLVAQMNLDPRKSYDITQWIKIDGTEYYLLEAGIGDSYFLFNENGEFYERSGFMKDDTFFLMDEEVMVYPSDLRMNTLVKYRDQISNVRNGYEIKYAGAKLDRIWFDYLEYDGSDSSGDFEKISFPNKPGLITFNGKGLRVIKADDNSLTYMLLKNDD